MCLQGREKGTSWRSTCCLGGYAGRNRERWISFLLGKFLVHFCIGKTYFLFNIVESMAESDCGLVCYRLYRDKLALFSP